MKGTLTTRISRQPRRFLREERGAVSVWFFFAMIPLLAMLGVAVDIGLIAAAQIQLQRGADAGSHAGVKAMRDGLSAEAVRARAQQIVEDNVSLSGVTWAQPPRIGTYDLTSQAFSPVLSVHGVPAVEVEPVVPALRLTLLPLLGFSSARVTARAVAIGKKRELVIVQDTSGSFEGEFPQAQQADRRLVEQMSAQAVLGDRVGVVSFSDHVRTEQALTYLEGGTGALLSAIDHIYFENRGTNTEIGIRRAIDLFQGSNPAETERVIILVSDGAPQNQAGAEAAADDAWDDGIHLFPVHLQQDYGSAANMQALERGIGRYYGTPNADDLDEILLTILGGLPIHLAE